MKRVVKKLSNFCKDKFSRSGISDIVVVRWNNKQYKSTPFTVCFGSQKDKYYASSCVTMRVNDKLIKQAKFRLDQQGFIDPVIPSQQILALLNLNNGRNDIQFILNKDQAILECQIHLFDQNDRIIISDVDGTLTKSDFYGMVNNLMSRQHVHNGYVEFIQNATINGYKIVWLTMRSVGMYSLSKSYIKMHTQAPGPLFPWPQQILSALKKQITKNTVDPKLFLLRNIRDVFPQNVNPFAGALGNRQNDAIAYSAADIPLEKIFLVDTSSVVQRWGHHQKISYDHLSEQIQKYFPSLVKQDKKEQTSLIFKKSSSIKTKDTQAQLNGLKEFIMQNRIELDFFQQEQEEQKK